MPCLTRPQIVLYQVTLIWMCEIIYVILYTLFEESREDSTVRQSVRERSGEKLRTAFDKYALRHAEHHINGYLSAQDPEDALKS